MISDTDPEMGGAVQLMGILRVLIDPDNMQVTANVSQNFFSTGYNLRGAVFIITNKALKYFLSTNAQDELLISVQRILPGIN